MSAFELWDRLQKILAHCREIHLCLLNHEAKQLELIERFESAVAKLEARDELHARLLAETSKSLLEKSIVQLCDEFEQNERRRRKYNSGGVPRRVLETK